MTKASGGTWEGQARLDAAIQADGRSMSAISLAAGQKRGYLRTILKGGRVPTTPRLKAICRVLGIPAGEVMDGLAPTDDPEIQELHDLWETYSQEKKRALLAVAK